VSPRQRPRKASASKRKAPAKKTAKRTARSKGSPEQARQRPPAPEGRGPTVRPTPDRSVIDQLSPRLREEFAHLQKEESRILKGLEHPEIRQRFLTDPAGALDQMGVQVPPLLKKRLRAKAGPPDLLLSRQFRLPTGQVVTPKINVRFTSGKRASR